MATQQRWIVNTTGLMPMLSKSFETREEATKEAAKMCMALPEMYHNKASLLEMVSFKDAFLREKRDLYRSKAAAIDAQLSPPPKVVKVEDTDL